MKKPKTTRDLYLDLSRHLQLERDTEDAWAEFCANCRERITGAHSAWVRESVVGDPEMPEVEDEWFCEKCVAVSDQRKFRGSPPPEMERIPKG